MGQPKHPAASPTPPTPAVQGRQVAIPVALALPIVLALAAGVAVYFSGGDFDLPVPAFYGTAAEIIPVLILAFTLESRAVDFLADPRAKLYRVQLFLFLSIGELCALLGVSGAVRGSVSATSPDFEHGLIASSLSLSNVIAGVRRPGL